MTTLDNPGLMNPRRALLHPLWLGSLTVLALNDHVLKGAGVLPDVVTGKLSDFAGLLVAPLLLAVVVGVRRRRGWLAAHVAVGVVFGAIQLSQLVAALWSDAIGMIGMSWVTTADPTDLLALPMLAVSAWFYPRVMQHAARTQLRRGSEYAMAGAGVMLCAATSPAEPDWPDPDLETDVWLHNGTDNSVVVRVRPLKASVDADCDVIETDPGRLLTEPVFGNAISWTLDPDENLDIRRGVNGQLDEWEWVEDAEALPQRECMVGLVDIDGVAPAVFFWRERNLEVQTVPSKGWNDELGGGVMIEADDDGNTRITEDTDDVAFTMVTDPPPSAGVCAPQDEGDRIAWGETPVGQWTLAAVKEGYDGCLAIDLIGQGGDPEIEAAHRWYLCVPAEVFPFEPLDDFAIDTIDTGASAGVLLTGSFQANLAELWVYAGGLAPATKGISFAPVPDYGCDLRAELECGTVARSSVMVAGGGAWEAKQIGAGESATLVGDGQTAKVFIAHAQERVVVDAECAEGPDTIGDDLEVAVAIIPDAE